MWICPKCGRSFKKQEQDVFYFFGGRPEVYIVVTMLLRRYQDGNKSASVFSYRC